MSFTITPTEAKQYLQDESRWIPKDSQDKCMKCSRAFGFFRWKHHCRLCGEVACDDCAPKGPIFFRGCAPCLQRVANAVRSAKATPSATQGTGATSATVNTSSTTSSSALSAPSSSLSFLKKDDLTYDSKQLSDDLSTAVKSGDHKGILAVLKELKTISLSVGTQVSNPLLISHTLLACLSDFSSEWLPDLLKIEVAKLACVFFNTVYVQAVEANGRHGITARMKTELSDSISRLNAMDSQHIMLCYCFDLLDASVSSVLEIQTTSTKVSAAMTHIANLYKFVMDLDVMSGVQLATAAVEYIASERTKSWYEGVLALQYYQKATCINYEERKDDKTAGPINTENAQQQYAVAPALLAFQDHLQHLLSAHLLTPNWHIIFAAIDVLQYVCEHGCNNETKEAAYFSSSSSSSSSMYGLQYFVDFNEFKVTSNWKIRARAMIACIELANSPHLCSDPKHPQVQHDQETREVPKRIVEHASDTIFLRGLEEDDKRVRSLIGDAHSIQAMRTALTQSWERKKTRVEDMLEKQLMVIKGLQASIKALQHHRSNSTSNTETKPNTSSMKQQQDLNHQKQKLQETLRRLENTGQELDLSIKLPPDLTDRIQIMGLNIGTIGVYGNNNVVNQSTTNCGNDNSTTTYNIVIQNLPGSVPSMTYPFPSSSPSSPLPAVLEDLPFIQESFSTDDHLDVKEDEEVQEQDVSTETLEFEQEINRYFEEMAAAPGNTSKPTDAATESKDEADLNKQDAASDAAQSPEPSKNESSTASTNSCRVQDSDNVLDAKGHNLAQYPSCGVSEDCLPRIVSQKLKNPGLRLSVEDQITCLVKCIEVGVREAHKALDQDLLMVIGNTGAGKSTFVNYLHGCTLKRVKKKTLGIKGGGFAICVDPDSEYPCVMEIGHTNESKTFLPGIYQSERDIYTYCDCPGFLDNRGSEINIANAVNIRQTVKNAKTVKVIVIINYFAIHADRGKGIRDMIQILKDLMGSPEEVINNADSILIGISQAHPLALAASATEPSDVVEALCEVEGIQSTLGDMMTRLRNNIFVFDPLDEGDADEGWILRQQLLDRFKTMVSITNPGNIFQTVLSGDDERALNTIVLEMFGRIRQKLQESNFSEAGELFRHVEQIEAIDNVLVTRMLHREKASVNAMIRSIEYSIVNAIIASDLTTARTELIHLCGLSLGLRGINGIFDVHEKIIQLRLYINTEAKKLIVEAKRDAYVQQLKDVQQELLARNHIHHQKQLELESSLEQMAQSMRDDKRQFELQRQQTEEEYEKKIASIQEKLQQAPAPTELKRLEEELKATKQDKEMTLKNQRDAEQAVSAKNKELLEATSKLLQLQNEKIEENNAKLKQMETEKKSQMALSSMQTGTLKETLLEYAGTENFSGVKAIVAEFQRRGISVDGPKNLVQSTALIIAAHRGSVGIVKLLLDAGANINLQNQNSYAALGRAACEGHVDVTACLLEHKASLSLVNSVDASVLQSACYHGHYYVAAQLIDAKCNVNYRAKKGGYSYGPLHNGAQRNFASICHLLCSRGAQLELPNEGGSTPLLVAGYFNKPLAAQYLIEAKADMNKLNLKGYTPFTITALRGSAACMKVLLAYGANIYVKDPNNKYCWEYTKDPSCKQMLMDARAGKLPSKPKPLVLPPLPKPNAPITDLPQYLMY